MRIYFFCVFIVTPLTLLAQLPYYNLSAEGQGIGKTFSLIEGPDAIFTNPAGIATVEKLSLMAITQHFTGKPGVQNSGIGVIYRSHLGCLSFSGMYPGEKLFNYNKLSLGWAKKFKTVQFGVQAGWITHPNGPTIHHAFILDFSSLAVISSDIKLGGGIYNITNSSEAQMIVRTGLDYNPVFTIHIIAEVEKNLWDDPNYRFGASYLWKKIIYISTGVTLKSFSQTFGLGLFVKKFVVHWSLEKLRGNEPLQSLSLQYSR